MIKNPVLTVWLRLICALLVFFMFWVTMGSVPGRSRTVDIGRVLEHSVVLVLKGPVFPLFLRGNSLGIPAALLFWCALLGTACGSRKDRTRRWFYALFGVYVVMTSLGILGAIARGLMAMAHAIG
jgi:D-alanyl-lipoteichoic acid acyltransferase DltB (MBOAT superfamily)